MTRDKAIIDTAVAEGVRRLFAARILTPRETVQECDRLLGRACMPETATMLKKLRHRAAAQLL